MKTIDDIIKELEKKKKDNIITELELLKLEELYEWS